MSRARLKGHNLNLRTQDARLALRRHLKAIIPQFLLRSLSRLGLYHYAPPVGKIGPRDFKSITPFSKAFGYDRGGPVDRYYIENFLRENADAVKGRALEIGDNEYTLMFGQSAVTKSDILHVDGRNSKATIVADLSNAPQIPDNTFDCIVLTQTLHLIYDHKAALQTCYRILKPGGSLLLTVPGITRIDQGEWKDSWFWAFTDGSIRRMLKEVFPGPAVIRTHGNVYIASAFLYGMGITEVTRAQLDHHDPHYQVIITARAIKPGWLSTQGSGPQAAGGGRG